MRPLVPFVIYYLSLRLITVTHKVNFLDQVYHRHLAPVNCTGKAPWLHALSDTVKMTIGPYFHSTYSQVPLGQIDNGEDMRCVEGIASGETIYGGQRFASKPKL